MNTPAHVVLSAVALGRGNFRNHWLAITLGALAPDAPMLFFYAYQRGWLGRAEEWIWSEGYYQTAWQSFFDVFNSLPLIALGGLIAWRFGATPLLAFFASMALHCLGDLPLHREDAHAHFFPFSSWHFVSPVSYWDPAHHGSIVLGLEALLIVAGCLWLARLAEPRAWRWVGVTTLSLYVVFAAYAMLIWL